MELIGTVLICSGVVSCSAAGAPQATAALLAGGFIAFLIGRFI